MQAIGKRVRDLGCNRSQYVIKLLEKDIEESRKETRRRFASEDLIGSFRTGLSKGDNATVRDHIRHQLNAKNR